MAAWKVKLLSPQDSTKVTRYTPKNCPIFFIGMALALLPYLTTSGQTRGVDSLRATLAAVSPKSSRYVDILNEMTARLIYQEPDSALHTGKRALKQAELLDYQSGKAIALNRIGGAYWSKGEMNQALTHFQDSEELAARLGDEKLVARNIGNRGIIYAVMGNNPRAIRYYRQALSYFLVQDNQERIAVSYNNMGKAFMEIGKYDSAELYLQRALPISEQEAPLLYSILHFNLADLYFRMENYERAEVYINQSLLISRQVNDLRSRTRSFQLLAEIRLREGLTDQAYRLAAQATELAEKTQVPELLYLCHHTLSRVLAQQGNYQEAYHYQTRYTERKDSLQNIQTQRSLDFTEYERKQQEVNLLRRENREQRYENYMLFTFLVLAAMLLLIFYRFQHILMQRNQHIEHQKDEISEQAKRLEQLNQVKDRLFSIISHDLRSPLNSLKGFLSLATSFELSREELQTALGKIDENVHLTSDMLENLLHWVRAQMNGTQIRYKVLDMHKLGADKVKLFAASAKRKGVHLVSAIPEGTEIIADEGAVRLIFRNLITNAIKFSHREDSITLGLAPEASSRKTHLAFFVQDTGVGVPEEKVKLLLGDEHFSMLGTNFEKGTGLGLHLCKEFVEAHGGKLRVSSQEGKGTCVTFTLPSSSQTQLLESE